MDSNQPGPKPPLRASLLGIPLEHRTIIYECFLCNDMAMHLAKVRDDLRDRRRFNGQSTPMIALLFVSKVINEEATPVFYGKNIWWMADWGLLGTEPCSRLWQKYALHFRHVSIHVGDKDASEDLRKHIKHDYSKNFEGRALIARLVGDILSTTSMKEYLSRKIVLAMRLSNLESFKIVFLLEDWYFSCRTPLLEHIVETIRGQAYAILEEDPMRTWKLDCLASIDWEEQEIMHHLDDMAPRLTWTFRTMRSFVYRYV